MHKCYQKFAYNQFALRFGQLGWERREHWSVGFPYCLIWHLSAWSINILTSHCCSTQSSTGQQCRATAGGPVTPLSGPFVSIDSSSVSVSFRDCIHSSSLQPVRSTSIFTFPDQRVKNLVQEMTRVTTERRLTRSLDPMKSSCPILQILDMLARWVSWLVGNSVEWR